MTLYHNRHVACARGQRVRVDVQVYTDQGDNMCSAPTTNSPESAAVENKALAYLYNVWYPALWLVDVQRKRHPLTLLEGELVVYRTADAVPVTLGNRCPHRFTELHRGKIVGEKLECPYHGMQLGPNGASAHNPHGPSPAAARVRSYPTIERHTLIWVWMGIADRADPNLIPNYSIIVDTIAHSAVTGKLELASDYQHYSDNLLELSHTEWVHPGLMQPRSLDRSKYTVRVDKNTVHFYPGITSGARHRHISEDAVRRPKELMAQVMGRLAVPPKSMTLMAVSGEVGK